MIQLLSVLILIGANALLWSVPTPHGLSVTFFNVGQGDSILVEGPTGVQMLVDGGLDGSALRELGKRLPFWDRSLDAVVATHPDADHIGGLADILERYEVKTIIESGVESDTRAWASTVDAINTEIEDGAQHVVARAGQRILLGRGAYADVLYPDHDVSNIKDTNSGSVVLRVVYGKTAFMLTGDAPTEVEYDILRARSDVLSTVLKAGHHGSKTSSSEEWVSAVAPRYVVFSRGCDNKYGHPAEVVVDRFINFGIQAFDTCEEGTVFFSSDARTISFSSDDHHFR